MRASLFRPGTICLVALLVACTASFSITPPTVTSVTAKVNAPQSGTYQPGQVLTGNTTHKAIFDTTNGELQPFKLIVGWRQSPSWVYGEMSDSTPYYTFYKTANVVRFSDPNPIVIQGNAPTVPGQYTFTAVTFAIPCAATKTYPPYVDPPLREYQAGDELQSDPDVTQIDVSD